MVFWAPIAQWRSSWTLPIGYWLINRFMLVSTNEQVHACEHLPEDKRRIAAGDLPDQAEATVS